MCIVIQKARGCRGRLYKKSISVEQAMIDFDEKAVIERIVQLRQNFAGDKGKARFARTLGVKLSAYNNYEKDQLPPVAVLLKICEVTGTDPNWLLTGNRPTAQNPQATPSLGPELTKKLGLLLQSSPESINALSCFIDLLSEKKQVEKKSASKTPKPKTNRPGWIPIIGRTAAGMPHFWQQTTLPEPQDAIAELDQLVEKHTGRAIMASASGVLALDLQIPPLLTELKTRTANLIQIRTQTADPTADQVVQFIQCRQFYELFPDAFALQVDGDSMSPRINDTDIVVLSPSVPAAQGHIAVAKLKDQIGVSCKLLRTTESKVHLVPINEKYQIKTLPRENLLWALAVLCHIRI